MNWQELISSLTNNFSISDIVASLSMIGAIVAAIFARRDRLKAKANAELAEQYAKNANEANQSAKKYYDEMHAHLEKQSEQYEKEELKKQIQVAMVSGNMFTASEIAERIGMTDSPVEAILNELKIEMKVKSFDYKPPRWKLVGVESATDAMNRAMKNMRDRVGR